MVKVKRIYDPVAPDDGKRILVDRLWPRGIKKEKIDEWVKEVAPSDALRKWYSHDPSKHHEFKQRYRKELENKQDLLERIRNEARKGTITLLYSAKDTERNNAIVLREILG